MTKHCQWQPDHFAPTILHALDGDPDRTGRKLPIPAQVQLECADLGGPKHLRRPVEIARELRDILQVGTLRGQPEVAKPHVLGHALAKRGHRWLLCRMGRATGAAPRSSKRIHRTKEVQRAELQARSAPMISSCKM